MSAAAWMIGRHGVASKMMMIDEIRPPQRFRAS
jgi:hypothetical protein